MDHAEKIKIIPHSIALTSGACAGLGVDITLFPLDTLKTRLQSEAGLLKSGGFSRLWYGIGPVAIGSAPSAAIFFLAYESGKSRIFPHVTDNLVLNHALSATFGEVTSLIVRVPVEIIKQRMQVSAAGSKSLDIFKAILRNEGPKGLLRGYTTTVLREVPFSLIEMPLWEWLKQTWAQKSNVEKVTPVQSAACGALAGALSAAVTTPLDVAKTRIMLAEPGSPLALKQSASLALEIVFKERGFKGLFAGILPRITWTSIGGALFLGIYDYVVSKLHMTDKK